MKSTSNFQEVFQTIFSDHPNYQLYQDIIQTTEGIIRGFDPMEVVKQNLAERIKTEEIITKRIIDAGLMGIGVSESDGGLGEDFTPAVIVSDLMSQKGLSSSSFAITMFCRHPLLLHGTQEQKEKYAYPTLEGKARFCILATEPNAGTNTFRITTKAKRTDKGWLLNGQKIWISAADKYEYGFLIAKTDLDMPTALSIFTIDMKSPGITMQKLNADIFPTESQFMVFFDNVELPEDALIGQEGMGGLYMFDGLNTERLMASIGVLGAADLALDITKKYVNERILFGNKPIGSYQGVQHPLAASKVNVDAARLMVYAGLKALSAGLPVGNYANSAKYLASTAANTMVDNCIQFHGGTGLDSDTGLMRLWAFTRAMRIVPINNEMILNFIAEQSIGLPKSY